MLAGRLRSPTSGRRIGSSIYKHARPRATHLHMPTSPRLGHGITLPAHVANVPWQSHYDHLLLTPRPAWAMSPESLRVSGSVYVPKTVDSLEQLRPAARAFVEEVQKVEPSASKACSHAALARIDHLAELYNNATKEHTPSYNTPGKWGIFARGGQRDYKGTKTTFIRDVLCQRHHLKHAENPSEKRKKLTVCEIGFMAGMSSMLFMESLPHARYLGFDLGNYAWSRPATSLLRQAYGLERFGGVVFGRASATIPSYHAMHPELSCDVVYVDGAKGYNPVMINLLDLRNVSYKGATLIFDEATSEGCVNGTLRDGVDVSCDAPMGNNGLNTASSARAYNIASKAGFIQVSSCAATPYQNWSTSWHDMDTLCAGTYLK